MKTFLDRGLDVNIRAGDDEWTALMNAAARGHLTSLKLLLDAGADPDLESAHGKTALILAALNNYPEIVSELLRGGANEKMEYLGRSAQQWAEEEGHQDVIKIFEVLSNNKSINTEMQK